MGARTGVARRRPLPHHRGDAVVVVTDEDTALPLPTNPGKGPTEPVLVLTCGNGSIDQ